MSITVYRTRNGVQEPIKLHILDALRGAPPIRRPSSRNSSSRSAASTRSSSTTWSGSNQFIPKSNGNSSNPSNNPNGNSNGHTSHSTSPPETFTPEDDQKLIGMKAEGKHSWKQICNELGKTSVSQVKEHFKAIEGKVVVGADANAWKNKNANGSVNSNANAGKASAENDKGSADKTTGKKKSKKNKDPDPQTASKTSAKGNTMPGAYPGSEIKSSLKHYASQYDEKKWLVVASKHYDRTGERIGNKRAEELYG